MSWTKGIKADVEACSFTTKREWHAYIDDQIRMAEIYPKSGPKADERRPYIEGAKMVVNWLVYDGPTRPDYPDVQAAMVHITKCLSG